MIAIDTPSAIERFARRDLALHVYELGDLDPFFFPNTRWWGLPGGEAGSLSALALLYEGADPPTLLALGRNDRGALAELLEEVREVLPARVYAHLSPGLVDRLTTRYQAEHHGLHLKMVLRDPEPLREVDAQDVVRLDDGDLPALVDLYARAYPGNWFDARMLATGQYFGIRRGTAIVAVAGIHVFAPGHGVAALGNVTTDPLERGRGLARRTVARLCRSLLDSGCTTIGLNVHADNAAAIHCYERLGFAIEAEYDEFMLSAPAARAAGSRTTPASPASD